MLENPTKGESRQNDCSDEFVKDELNLEDLKYENSHEANEELLSTLADNNQEDIKGIKLGKWSFIFYIIYSMFG